MKITFLGHSGFRIEIAGQVLLLDPWLKGNPKFPEARRAEAIAGATHVILTHGHFDHTADGATIAGELGIPVVGIYDLMSHYERTLDLTTVGFNKGGTVSLGDVRLTMVSATHSSTAEGENGPFYAGTEAGYMIAGEGKTIYVSGDTDVMADMGVFEALHHPQIGILCAGGYFTMDMKRAAYAARTFFNFETVIPCHFGTFPVLEQNADVLKAELPGVNVIEPQVLEPIEL
ncbi:MAG: metal-dependent hydrolase [Alphaproteobacteria bacterium]|nr:MAG: metal-dependent hydrolase [Alphaproteobacteria bacterium]